MVSKNYNQKNYVQLYILNSCMQKKINWFRHINFEILDQSTGLFNQFYFILLDLSKFIYFIIF